MNQKDFERFVAGLATADVAVHRALRELIRLAGPSGALDRHLWVRAIQEGLRRDGVSTRSFIPAHLSEAGTPDRKDRVLAGIDELGRAELVGFEPEGPDWNLARIDVELWADLLPQRSSILDRLSVRGTPTDESTADAPPVMDSAPPPIDPMPLPPLSEPEMEPTPAIPSLVSEAKNRGRGRGRNRVEAGR